VEILLKIVYIKPEQTFFKKKFFDKKEETKATKKSS
jgi:hypothetical protein